MKLNVQKRIAADVLKCSRKRVVFDESQIGDIKEAITKSDIRGLIHDDIIKKIPAKGISSFRSRALKIQKSKGRRSGQGSRKGRSGARTNPKESWMARLRLQRHFLSYLRDKNIIPTKTYRELYLKSKGGYFRSKRHLIYYLTEQNIVAKEVFENPNAAKAKTAKKTKGNA